MQKVKKFMLFNNVQLQEKYVLSVKSKKNKLKFVENRVCQVIEDKV